MSNWENNSLQFARLLSEIMATQELDLEVLAESMDLSVDEVGELFDRANLVWEEAKEAGNGADVATDAVATALANQLVTKLANQFSLVLRDWMTEDQMAEVLLRNVNETNPSICHTHDFVDANQAMLDAAEMIGIATDDVGIDTPATDGVLGTHLWNAAWNLAKSNGFRPSAS